MRKRWKLGSFLYLYTVKNRGKGIVSYTTDYLSQEWLVSACPYKNKYLNLGTYDFDNVSGLHHRDNRKRVMLPRPPQIEFEVTWIDINRRECVNILCIINGVGYEKALTAS